MRRSWLQQCTAFCPGRPHRQAVQALREPCAGRQGAMCICRHCLGAPAGPTMLRPAAARPPSPEPPRLQQLVHHAVPGHRVLALKGRAHYRHAAEGEGKHHEAAGAASSLTWGALQACIACSRAGTWQGRGCGALWSHIPQTGRRRCRAGSPPVHNGEVQFRSVCAVVYRSGHLQEEPAKTPMNRAPKSRRSREVCLGIGRASGVARVPRVLVRIVLNGQADGLECLLPCAEGE